MHARGRQCLSLESTDDASVGWCTLEEELHWSLMNPEKLSEEFKASRGRVENYSCPSILTPNMLSRIVLTVTPWGLQRVRQKHSDIPDFFRWVSPPFSLFPPSTQRRCRLRYLGQYITVRLTCFYIQPGLRRYKQVDLTYIPRYKMCACVHVCHPK